MRMRARRLALFVGVAFAMTSGPALAAEESLVEVTATSKAGIDQLAANYDVAEYLRKNSDGTLTTAVYAEDSELAAIRAAGFTLGATIEDSNTRLERAEAREAARAAEEKAAQLASDGAPNAGARARGDVPVPGETVIQRANTFTNYAGRYLYVEAHNKNTVAVPRNEGGTEGPTLTLSYAGRDGVWSEPVRMGAFVDRDPNADTYMYHRQIVHLKGAAASVPAGELQVRVASSTPSLDSATASEWLGEGLPPHADGYLTGFHNRYMDPTEINARFTLLAAEFRQIAEIVNLPNKTNGYQRKSIANMNGTAGSAPACPARTATAPSCSSPRPGAIRAAT
jgi:hypothetical protein